MANYKRGKCRYHSSPHTSLRHSKSGYPHWHDILFHTRPRRMAEKRCLNALRQGVDPEDLAWPLSKKPHEYYW